MNGARNDRELARMLSRPVVQGLKIMSEQMLEPKITQIVNENTNRGSVYESGGHGSLSEAWSNKTRIGGRPNYMGKLYTYYDSAKLTYLPTGKHQTPTLWFLNDDWRYVPHTISRVTNLAEIIDLGKGGHLPMFDNFGDNPTWHATHFWDKVISSFNANGRAWIKSGLRQAGLTVLY